MNYRILGKTNLRVSEIGFGTWPLSGNMNGANSYGKTDEAESKNALRTAFINGINFFDTADLYGFGYVETLISKELGEVRNDILISTKGGMINENGDTIMTSSHLFDSLNLSLKRLNTDYVDVYLLHSPFIQDITDETMETLEKMKDCGKIRYYGLSTKYVNDGLEAINKYNFEIIETNFNVLDNRCKEIGLFDLCTKFGVGLIARTPFSQGIISGEFSYNEDKTDRRNLIPNDKYKKITTTYDNMLQHVNHKEYTKAQVALLYCLSESSVSTVIPGMKLSKEVLENCSVCGLEPLSTEELKLINFEYKRL